MSPEHFATKLTPYEAEAYLEGVMMRKRDGWEQARLIVSPWSSKDAQPIVFPWEKDSYKAPTEDEIEDTIQWAEGIIAQKNMQKHG